jgi:hypothetical protein
VHHQPGQGHDGGIRAPGHDITAGSQGELVTPELGFPSAAIEPFGISGPPYVRTTPVTVPTLSADADGLATCDTFTPLRSEASPLRLPPDRAHAATAASTTTAPTHRRPLAFIALIFTQR